METTFRQKIKDLGIKRIVKIITIGFGAGFIIFMSFFDAIFDFNRITWGEWLARTAVLVGIMIFGILMGNSMGTDNQKDKTDGAYQTKCKDYDVIRQQVDYIIEFFAQFWLWFKQKTLIEKKMGFLIDNQFDMRVAKVLVKHIELEDLEVGKLIYDENKPIEKVYIKGDVKLQKINISKLDILKKALTLSLDTYGESYYLSRYDDDDTKTNEAEKGKRLAQKIARDKRRNFIIKISSSLIISIVWSALTISEFASGDEGAIKKAWLNLISRITALITSYVSGYTTSVVNVKDQARAIENKTSILTQFKNNYEKKIFVPETYEEMIEREIREQKEYEESHKVEIEIIEPKEESIELIPKLE